MKNIIPSLLISINDNLKMNHQDAFNFLISCDILIKMQIKANL